MEAKRWAQPDPFTPVVRTASIEAGGKIVSDLADAAFAGDWRIYGRDHAAAACQPPNFGKALTLHLCRAERFYGRYRAPD